MRPKQACRNSLLEISGSPPHFNTPQHTRKRDTSWWWRWDKVASILKSLSFRWLCHVYGNVAHQEDSIWRCCEHDVCSNDDREEWAVYLPTGHSGTGSESARDDELGEWLMNLTWQVVKEKTEPSLSDKGCPFEYWISVHAFFIRKPISRVTLGPRNSQIYDLGWLCKEIWADGFMFTEH